MRPLAAIAAIALALGAVEGLAWWWMHPAPAGLGEPVLVYRPKVGLDRRSGPLDANGVGRAGNAEVTDQQQANATAQSTSSIQNLKSKIQNSNSSSTYTPLPAVVTKSLPALRCSTGTAARIDRDDGATINIAFFEWDLADSTNVLEAFKHLPEECMGSIGMTLVEKAPVRTYVVRGQESEVRNQEETPSPEPNSKFKIQNLKSPHRGETLAFDHTVFRDPRGGIIHAFKGTWVSGASSLIGNGFRGGADQSRQIRWKAALKRFRPAHARVAQGAVRGIPDPNLAWLAFQESMLVDLRMEKQN